MSPSSSDVGRDGLHGVVPEREAPVGQRPQSAGALWRRRSGGGPAGGSDRGPGGGAGLASDVESGVASGAGAHVPSRPVPRSYYGLPILNQPTWEPLDIAGYLFLGGLAGASSTLAAAAELTGRPELARPLRYGAAGAISLSLAALVHDLGRPSRFYNMLRVFKPSSPMSVGSWILSTYGPLALGSAAVMAAGSSLPAPVRTLVQPLSRPLTVAAGLVGPAVATYTAVLVSDTAVPAWHGGYTEMPFVFAGSAASAAGGLGLIAAPLRESEPARRLGVAGALVEVALGRVMRRRMGLPSEAYESGKAGKLIKAAEALAVTGAALSVAGRRSRSLSAVAGACLLAGSALTRFGIFHAGVQSANEPRYTVEPQREKLDRGA